MSLRDVRTNLKNQAAHFGWTRALARVAIEQVNRVFTLRRLDVVVLRPTDVREAPEKPGGPDLSCRVASQDEIKALANDPRWEIGAELKRENLEGASMLLSCVGGKPAGYTWFKAQGTARIFPTLSVRIPPGYVYNFAALTQPEFRGLGLQPFRHRKLLEHLRATGAQGLLGYVDWLNAASKAGQAKSGYKPLGSIWLVGTRRIFWAHFSKGLRALGIVRSPHA